MTPDAATHDPHHGHEGHGESHGSRTSYLIGFGLSVVLTASAAGGGTGGGNDCTGRAALLQPATATRRMTRALRVMTRSVADTDNG